MMQGYNCILIFDKTGEKILFCKRTKNPYQGKYNLVGGKIEPGEDGYAAAYRELQEETGIDYKQVKLKHISTKTK